jgi:hypothetical protein
MLIFNAVETARYIKKKALHFWNAFFQLTTNEKLLVHYDLLNDRTVAGFSLYKINTVLNRLEVQYN